MAATEVGHVASRAVDDLYREHGREVYRYAYAVLGNHADAEDVTQTTFLNAYRALGQGVRPKKPSNWLLAIASNAIKQRFRQEQARPREVELDERIARSESDGEGPSIGELLTALSKIPQKQRQAIVLREFEGRTYSEMAGILGVTTSALETLLFRARRSLAEELEHQLTCPEAQLAVSKAVDDRLGRKERRRLRAHLGECPDCAHFARLQPRHRSALRGLMLVPVPLSFPVLEGLAGPDAASAATTSFSAGEGASVAATGGSLGSTGASAVVGSVALKAAAVVAAVTITGGLAVEGARQLRRDGDSAPVPLAVSALEPRATQRVLPREPATAPTAPSLPGMQTSRAPTDAEPLPNAGSATYVAVAGTSESTATETGTAPDGTTSSGQEGHQPGGPRGDQPGGGQPTGGQPTGEEQPGGQPTGGQPTGSQPTGGEPTGEQPGAGGPHEEQPQGAAPLGDVPQGEVPKRGVPQGDDTGGDEATTGHSAEDESTASKKQKPAKKQKKPKKPKPTTPAATKPAGQQPPGHDQPKPEKQPKAEEPKPEAPPPGAEAPTQEKEPKPENGPKADEPKAEKPEKEPKAEDPKPEKEPKADDASSEPAPPSAPPPPTGEAGGHKKP